VDKNNHRFDEGMKEKNPLVKKALSPLDKNNHDFLTGYERNNPLVKKHFLLWIKKQASWCER
jgi:hypothetical protein